MTERWNVSLVRGWFVGGFVRSAVRPLPLLFEVVGGLLPIGLLLDWKVTGRVRPFQSRLSGLGPTDTSSTGWFCSCRYAITVVQPMYS